MNIALAGEEAAGVRALQLIADRPDARLALVLSSGRGETASVAEAALARGLRVEPAARVKDPELARELADLEIDLLVNVHSLSIAHAAVVEAPRVGSFNLHPGPLPAYAGLNAPSWAIYEGATDYGVTLHWMTAAVDAGPIAYASPVPIGERDTGLTIMARCVRSGVPLLTRLLDDAAGEGVRGIPREAQPIPPVDRGPGPPLGGQVDWTRPARLLDALVRACDYGPFRSPWGRAGASLGGSTVGLVQTRVGERGEFAPGEPGAVVGTAGDAVAVATGDGVLVVTRLEHDGDTVPAASVAAIGARFAA